MKRIAEIRGLGPFVRFQSLGDNEQILSIHDLPTLEKAMETYPEYTWIFTNNDFGSRLLAYAFR